MAVDTQSSDKNMAVMFRNASKSFDKGKIPVLDNMNMRVPRGCIYGLLGASGCGKTTLLSVVVGLLKLDAGEVEVLGGTPGKKGSGIPGPRLGYMPQDSALVEEFSVENVMYYFGWLYGMKQDDIATRFDFLGRLLDLPNSKFLVKDLSGGQLRRLSLAVSVIHTPELLILDEPTVGQDPTLRHKIWEYILKLSNEDNITIIITTHYISEAKDAHRVGIMRNGALLAEATPSKLLSQFNCENLEEVSYILSQRQSDRIRPEQNGSNQFQMGAMPATPDVNFETFEADFVTEPFTNAYNKTLRSSTSTKMKALLYKNYVKVIRNKMSLFFFFVFPMFIMGCFYAGVYKDPHDLRVGIVNEELGNCNNLPGGLALHSGVDRIQGAEEEECHFRGLSCLYIDLLDHDTIKHIFYDTLEEGLRATERGHTFTTLYFNKNFTTAMQQRHNDQFGTDNETVDMSRLRIWEDKTDFTIGNILKAEYVDKFKTLTDYIADRCNLTKKASAVPLRFNDPIYGSTDDGFFKFVAPGVLMSVLSFMATTFSSSVIIMEKSEGVWARNIVAGVTTTEIISSHMICQVIIIIIQLTELLLTTLYLFNIENIGNIWAVLLLVFLQGLSGNALGLTISGLASDVSTAFGASMGSFLPIVLLSGILWPLESLPPVVKYISLCLPCTYPLAALRNIMFRGWFITNNEVYPGFLISLAWVIILTGIGTLSTHRSR